MTFVSQRFSFVGSFKVARTDLPSNSLYDVRHDSVTSWLHFIACTIKRFRLFTVFDAFPGLAIFQIVFIQSNCGFRPFRVLRRFDPCIASKRSPNPVLVWMHTFVFIFFNHNHLMGTISHRFGKCQLQTQAPMRVAIKLPLFDRQTRTRWLFVKTSLCRSGDDDDVSYLNWNWWSFCDETRSEITQMHRFTQQSSRNHSHKNTLVETKECAGLFVRSGQQKGQIVWTGSTLKKD